MKKRIIMLCCAAIMAVAQGFCKVTLTVPEVSIAPGGTSYAAICFDLGMPAYTAYQFDIEYPEGISPVSDDNGNPAFTKADVYDTEHNVSSIRTNSGLNRFQCFSINSMAFTSQRGTLLILPIKAQKTMMEGTYQAKISPIEFVQTDATPDRPDAVTFSIKVTRSLELDESSTLAPPAANAVDVKVKRTISADEWSTICLPFAMTTNQVKAAFGSDVKLGDFTGCTKHGDTDDVKVNFIEATAIEANHPYIIKVKKAINDFTVSGVDIAPDVAEVKMNQRRNMFNSFIGNYQNGLTLDDGMIFLNGNKFWFSKGYSKIKAFRAYFNLESADVYYDSRLNISFEESTGVSSSGIDDKGLKINDDTIYNLKGQRIQEPEDGLYIVNGKKLVKKAERKNVK